MSASRTRKKRSSSSADEAELHDVQPDEGLVDGAWVEETAGVLGVAVHVEHAVAVGEPEDGEGDDGEDDDEGRDGRVDDRNAGEVGVGREVRAPVHGGEGGVARPLLARGVVGDLGNEEPHD